jgi:hypothetical protein
MAQPGEQDRQSATQPQIQAGVLVHPAERREVICAGFSGQPRRCRAKPGQRGNAAGEDFTPAPEMISETSGHRRGDQDFSMPLLCVSQPPAQCMMRPNKSVYTANHPHACVQSRHAMGGMSRTAGHAGQTLVHGSVATSEKGCMPFVSSLRMLHPASPVPCAR